MRTTQPVVGRRVIDVSPVTDIARSLAQTGMGAGWQVFLPVCGEFRDPADEQKYRESTRLDRCRRLHRVAMVGALAFLLGGVVDWLLIGSSVRFLWLLLIRTAVAIALIAAGRLLARDSAMEDRLLLPMLLLVDMATCAIIVLSPGELNMHAVTVLTIVLVTYLFVPARTLQLAASACFLCVVFIALSAGRVATEGPGLTMVILNLSVANVLGALVARDHQLRDRRIFLSRRWEIERAAILSAEAEERREVDEALVQSEAKYRELVEMSPTAIAVHRNGTLVYVNPAGLELLRARDASAVVGASIFELVAPRYHKLISERLRTLAAEAEPLPVAELEIRRLDGCFVLCELVSGTTTFDGKPAIQSAVRDITERKHLEEELRRLATIDPLTDLCNRRHFFHQLETEWRRARRHLRPLSLLMIDLDRFKRINDQHGHAVGDQALIGFVRIIADILRNTDCFARVGGEEFAVILPETDLDGATQLAERCRLGLVDSPIPSAAGPLFLTASFGVAQCDLAHETTDQALRRADDALLAAKSGDRNRVEVSPTPERP